MDFLLPSQKAAVDALTGKLTGVLSFSWTTVGGEWAGLMSGETPALRCDKTDYYCAFVRLPESFATIRQRGGKVGTGLHCIFICPADDGPYHTYRLVSWDEALGHFRAWLTFVTRELEPEQLSTVTRALEMPRASPAPTGSAPAGAPEPSDSPSRSVKATVSDGSGLQITPPHTPIDVEKLSLGDLLGALARLSIKSIVFLVGLLTALVAGAYRFGHAGSETALASLRLSADSARHDKDSLIALLQRQDATREAVARRVAASPEVLEALVAGIRQDKPDGLQTDEAIRQSLLWQLTGLDGFAEFLRADSAYRLHIVFADSAILPQWTTAPSIVPDALRRTGGTPTDELLRALNAQLNRSAVAALGNGSYLIRTRGGLVVVTE